MRAVKVLAALAIAALGIGSFSAVAQAGTRYKGVHVKADFCDTGCKPHGQNPEFDKSGLVIAHVLLYQVGPLVPLSCWESRSIRLQVLDTNGVVLSTLDGSTISVRRREVAWTLSGQLPTTLPAGTNYVRVKTKKRTVSLGAGPYQGIGGTFKEPERTDGKFVCQAGFSRNVAIPAV
jgi:hypothetical protein